VRPETRALYLERFIHGAIFEARADVEAVVHAHAEDTLPFGIVRDVPLKPVIHSGSFIGSTVPVWDIADRFGDTNLLVTDMEKGRDLAAGLGAHSVVLMRGHGFAAAGRSLIEAVRLSIYLARNARAQFRAIQLGAPIRYLSQGEIDLRNKGYSPYSAETFRAWEYWANKAGVGKMVTGPGGARKRQQRKLNPKSR
jgi:HCOMODA/2-hydroxy-3-carboxy-muconic semialdehyde decarboxylase